MALIRELQRARTPYISPHCGWQLLHQVALQKVPQHGAGTYDYPTGRGRVNCSTETRRLRPRLSNLDIGPNFLQWKCTGPCDNVNLRGPTGKVGVQRYWCWLRSCRGSEGAMIRRAVSS